MAVNIAGATGTGTLGSIAQSAKAAAASPAGGFAESLGQLLEGVEKTTGDANEAVTGMLNKTGEVHDAMIALHQAEVSLQFTVQIRNKLVQAYQDIMRMPV